MTKEERDRFATDARYYFPTCMYGEEVRITNREALIVEGTARAMLSALLAREMLITDTGPIVGSRPGVVGDLVGRQQREIEALKLDLQKLQSFIDSAFVAHPNLDLDVERISLGF